MAVYVSLNGVHWRCRVCGDLSVQVAQAIVRHAVRRDVHDLLILCSFGDPSSIVVRVGCVVGGLLPYEQAVGEITDGITHVRAYILRVVFVNKHSLGCQGRVTRVNVAQPRFAC